MREGTNSACYGNFEDSIGLPCAHTLKQMTLNEQWKLPLSDIHPYWRLETPTANNDPILAIQNFIPHRRRGRPRAGQNSTPSSTRPRASTQREPSQFEVAEQADRATQQRAKRTRTKKAKEDASLQAQLAELKKIMLEQQQQQQQQQQLLLQQLQQVEEEEEITRTVTRKRKRTTTTTRPVAKKQQQQQEDEPITVSSSSSSSSEDDCNTMEEDGDTAFSSSAVPSVGREMPARAGRGQNKHRQRDC
ncbi:uncharacterized protein K452DRAFT_98267 [Aplosporella prunicola CBS 121167]|uniref:Uncharacterized protein n=1 Tax=Aplosporella prunicola CBS 121167 TaxID=1176127 RepID=A0A6A6B496_9PEZI|nr:uncharacterized protein K452DRAFT_98267 [Aplosporella prunicola CBS 121167]KAF2137777.1 hypothetical protein K452DRAFT_98267 [Aplosporella prunicola CBS 121167]